jgi:hypothetical protein
MAGRGQKNGHHDTLTQSRWDVGKSFSYFSYFLILPNRFRWVHCQVQVLRWCFARNLRRTFDELPKTLDATYERILREVPEQNRDDAHRLFQCLTVAVRPLCVEELAEVLAVDFTSEDIPKLIDDSRWGDQEQAVLLACSSLIAIVQEYDRDHRPSSRLVQFSHFLVKKIPHLETSCRSKGGYLALSYSHRACAHGHGASLPCRPLSVGLLCQLGDHQELPSS